MEIIELKQKKEIDELRKFYSDENPLKTVKIPERYITGDEFVKRGIENIEKFCKEHGLL